MTRAILIAALLTLALPAAAHAQTASDPDGVIATIQSQGEPLASCELAIAAREDPPLVPNQPNIEGSGAMGVFQFMPRTWASTPEGDVPLAVASVAEQIAAASWMLLTGQGSAWSPLPAECSGF